MKKHLYLIGLILIISGCLSGLILGALTFMIAIIGIALVIVSNQNIWIKLATVILLPIISVYGTTTFFFYG